MMIGSPYIIQWIINNVMFYGFLLTQDILLS